MKSALIVFLSVVFVSSAANAFVVFFPKQIDPQSELVSFFDKDLPEENPSSLRAILISDDRTLLKRTQKGAIRRRSTGIRCPCLHKVCTYHCMN